MAKENHGGKPWKIVKTFSVFEEADLARHELLESGAYQVKVKRTAANLYAVRTRLVKSEQKNSKNKSKGKNKLKGKNKKSE